MYYLGISAYYHDSAAALIRDGEIIAASQEERFTRKKHDSSFPKNAVAYCLEEAGIAVDQLENIIFYDKPLLKFERLLQTYIALAPRGYSSYSKAMPVWIKEKLFLRETIKREMKNFLAPGDDPKKLPKLLFASHHASHAASAFFPSPFKKAAVLCLDGVGEWATSTVWLGDEEKLTPLWEIRFPHSLGLLYSAFTYYTGFKVNSGEYKVMGLAPYGEPKYVKEIYEHLIDLKEDGTFRLNLNFFDYATGLRMTSKKFEKIFGGPPRKPETPISQREMDLARSIQEVTEEVVFRLAKTIHQETGCENLCLAGGVALNCVANGKLLKSGPFKDIWIQPAAGDAGGALGAAYLGYHLYGGKPRVVDEGDAMKGSYLGPKNKLEDVAKDLGAFQAVYEKLDETSLLNKVAGLIAEGNVVGWVQGRMEFGPRALGGRSIIGDARNTQMQSTMNLKIKYRESFRPFAPAVLDENVSDYFDMQKPSPYMLLVAPVKEDKRLKTDSTEQEKLFGIEKLKTPRSVIPAITHVDYSARIQTVHPHTNPRFHKLIKNFKDKTGCPVMVNTSFNVRGEPIVATAKDAYRCFMRTEMDYLVVEDFLLKKKDQPQWHETDDWRNDYGLD